MPCAGCKDNTDKCVVSVVVWSFENLLGRQTFDGAIVSLSLGVLQVKKINVSVVTPCGNAQRHHGVALCASKYAYANFVALFKLFNRVSTQRGRKLDARPVIKLGLLSQF